MGNLVSYGKYDPKAYEKEKEILGGTSEFIKLEGTKTLRFLPPKIGKNSPFQVIFNHFIKFPNADRAVVFNCPRVMSKRPCPACEQADKLLSSSHPGDQARAKELSAKPRVLANVIDRGDPDKGPQPIAFPKSVKGMLDELLEDPDWGDFFSPYGPDDIKKLKGVSDEDKPNAGYDIVIKRSGTTVMDTRYSVKGKPNPSPLADSMQQAQEWIDAQVDLAKYATIMSYDDILAKLSEASGVSTTGSTKRRNAADDLDDD